MVLNIAGIVHGREYWELTRNIIDELRKNSRLNKIAIEMSAKNLKFAGSLPEDPTERAVKYLYHSKFSSQFNVNPRATVEIAKAIKIGIIESNPSLRMLSKTTNRDYFLAEMSTCEYLRLLINYCKSHKIELMPLAKTSYRAWSRLLQVSKSRFGPYMGQARAEEELAGEIIRNRAQLNLIGNKHALSISSLVKKSAKERVKLIYCYRYIDALGSKLKTLLLGRLPLGLRSIRKKFRAKIRLQKL